MILLLLLLRAGISGRPGERARPFRADSPDGVITVRRTRSVFDPVRRYTHGTAVGAFRRYARPPKNAPRCRALSGRRVRPLKRRGRPVGFCPTTLRSLPHGFSCRRRCCRGNDMDDAQSPLSRRIQRISEIVDALFVVPVVVTQLIVLAIVILSDDDYSLWVLEYINGLLVSKKATKKPTGVRKQRYADWHIVDLELDFVRLHNVYTLVTFSLKLLSVIFLCEATTLLTYLFMQTDFDENADDDSHDTGDTDELDDTDEPDYSDELDYSDEPDDTDYTDELDEPDDTDYTDYTTDFDDTGSSDDDQLGEIVNPNELRIVSEWLNLSEDGFASRFYERFGLPPPRWFRVDGISGWFEAPMILPISIAFERLYSDVFDDDDDDDITDDTPELSFEELINQLSSINLNDQHIREISFYNMDDFNELDEDTDAGEVMLNFVDVG